MTAEPLLTTTDLARLLGVRTYQLVYACQQGHLPEPPRVAGRRVYGPAAVEQARRFVADHGVAGRRRGRQLSASTSTTETAGL